MDLVINNNILETVNQVVEIIRREEETEMANTMNSIIKNMYNKHHRLYMNDNPEKRKAIQEKYKASHPKTDEQKVRDKTYAKMYYLKKKEEKIRNNLDIS
jgi:hypothetical protein